MANPFFSGRIPLDLDERIKQYCAETKESKTQLLINALSAYLNHPIKAQAHNLVVSIEMFNDLEQRIRKLEKSIKITDAINIDNTTIPEQEASNIIVVKQADNSLINNDITNQDLVSEDQTQLSILDIEQQGVDRQATDLEDSEAETKVGSDHQIIVTTNKVPDLPGLEEMNRKQIINLLRNSKSSGKRKVKVGNYLLEYHEKEAGAKGSLLWKVIKIKP